MKYIIKILLIIWYSLMIMNAFASVISIIIGSKHNAIINMTVLGLMILLEIYFMLVDIKKDFKDV